jgi:hypothetical protein
MKGAQLRITTPRFVMGTLLKQGIEIINGARIIAALTIPNPIIEIIDALDPFAAAPGCVPVNIRDEITSTWPESVRSFWRLLFGESSPQKAVVLEFVKGVYTEAAEVFREYKDEPAWQAVAKKILKFGLPRLEVIMAQTKSVYSTYFLPCLALVMSLFLFQASKLTFILRSKEYDCSPKTSHEFILTKSTTSSKLWYLDQ